MVPIVDFFNVLDRDGIVVVERLVQAAQEYYPDWSPSSFKQALLEHTLANNRDISATEFRSRIYHALTEDLQILHQRLLESGKYLLLCFDTFELIERNPAVAVLHPAHSFPDNYGFDRIRVIVAGRNLPGGPDSNWRGRENEVEIVPVPPFNKIEVFQYLSIRSDEVTPEQASTLYEYTAGRPILLGLVSDVVYRGVISLKDLVATPHTSFEQKLVTQIKQLDNPESLVILFMAHIYHRFNISILEWLMKDRYLREAVQDTKYAALLMKLPTLSFVRRAGSGEDFVLHDEMRRLVINYCWSEEETNPRIRKDLSRLVIGYYEEKIAHEQDERMRQAYIVEMLYHQLFVDIHTGFQTFERLFDDAVERWLSTFARSLLQEAQQFSESLSQERRDSMKLAEVRLLQKEDNAAAALALCQELEHSASRSWLRHNRAEILYQKGYTYLLVSDFSNAIACLGEALSLYKARGNKEREAEILGSLGSIFRRQGELDKAVRYLQESRDGHKSVGNLREYAAALTAIGNIYRLQGKTEEALRICKIGLRMRQEMLRRGRGSEVAVALSLSNIGIIYLNMDDVVRAEAHFQQALDVYTRYGNKKWIAGTYNRFGQVEMAKAEAKGRTTEEAIAYLDAALEHFKKAYETSLGVDTEARINSLNKQGRVLSIREEWKEAQVLFQQAIDLAQQIHDDYQEAESYIDFAKVLGNLRHYKQAEKALQAADEISTRYNYYFLLGSSQELRGDLKYSEGDYQEAFEHYVKGCEYMTRYNPLRYEQSLRKIFDQLLNIPKTAVLPVLRVLSTYWFDRGLAKGYPELLALCEEARENLVDI